MAFGPDAVKGVGLGIGSVAVITSIAFVAAAMHQTPLDGRSEFDLAGRGVSLWSLLAAAVGAVATWEIVQVTVFGPGPAKWLTLANGIIVGTLACAGLVAHEISSERVVHCLEIVERRVS